MRYLQSLLLSFLTLLSVEGYRILAVFPYNDLSHFRINEAICRALAESGHQIDVISHFPLKKPIANYRDIVNLHGTRENMINNLTVKSKGVLQQLLMYITAITFGDNWCNLMGREDVQRLIKNPPNDPPYDLFITEYFGTLCYLGFGRLLNVPVVGISMSMDTPYIDQLLENPLSNYFMAGQHTTNYWDRLDNVVTNMLQSFIFRYYVPQQTEQMKDHLGSDMPDIWEAQKELSLILTNTHYSFHGTRPLVAALVEVGGVHVEMDDSKLPQELENWMDRATGGVVFFSLGSTVNLEMLPMNTIHDLCASFAKIAPIKVLMKITDENKLPLDLPDNVYTLSWISQIAVLKHNNTRVLITHGDQLGSFEACYFGIPVIGIPFMRDQMRNVNTFVQKGMGIKLLSEDISEKSMDAALNALLNDPKYMQSAKSESMRFRDRPSMAKDMAVYWIDYVVRNGPRSLRSPVMDMPWWQKNLFNVYAFL